jgi:hypothetical protein
MNESMNGQQQHPGSRFAVRRWLRQPRLWLPGLALALAITALAFRTAGGEDKSLGTWKVTESITHTPSSFPEHTLKLKVSHGTLTGTLSSGGAAKRQSSAKEWPITEAKLHGDEISFTVSHPFAMGGDITTTYQGKISGATIKGTFEVAVAGETFTRNWEAEQVKELSPLASKF